MVSVIVFLYSAPDLIRRMSINNCQNKDFLDWARILQTDGILAQNRFSSSSWLLAKYHTSIRIWLLYIWDNFEILLIITKVFSQGPVWLFGNYSAISWRTCLLTSRFFVNTNWMSWRIKINHQIKFDFLFLK